MSRFSVIIGFLCLTIIGSAVSCSYAGEIDLLLQKLVEKGVLSAGEAQQIRIETKEQVKAELASGKSASVPSWVQNIKLKGDFRLRMQHENRKGSNTNSGNSTDRTRARVRMRVGADAKVNDQVKVALGIATGNDSDPRSTNQTFGDSFAKKPVWLDYAYAEYNPVSWMTLIGGRMKNPLWEPGDMLWDTDINPEGGAIKLNRKLSKNLQAYLNTGFFVIDEISTTSDPWFYALQPGIKWQITEGLDLKAANSIYIFEKVKGASLDSSANSNTRQNSRLKYNYNAISPAFELGFSDPLKATGLNWNVPYFALLGEYVNNMSASNSNNGHMLGFKLGHNKVSDKGQWQLRYLYTLLETDAWLDILPDSDRYGGRTGIKGHEISLSYGLNKNCSIDFDYYRTDLTASNNNIPKTDHIFQADFNFKF